MSTTNEPPSPIAIAQRMGEATTEGRLRPTLNGFGWEHLFLDDVAVQFIDAMKAVPGQANVVDLFVRSGYSTSRVLSETTALVTACDPSSDHLAILTNGLSDAQRSRLTTKACDALELEFEESSLDGVLALRWMHFLRPAEIRQMFSRYAKWLKPGGLLCVVALSPNVAIAKEKFLAIYEERVRNGEEWPGAMEAGTSCWLKPAICIDHGYLFDLAVLERECQKVGLEVLRRHYISHEHSLSVNTHVGLLAVKR
ncbi:hypothetical protein BV898_16002 [Hypsibius exemplaris]|uniref:Methyltransferase domain-containing protein n=1 Tax=Hypsibius exemplaris TaxID=2072580 RepID=A0A9X6NE77_HYPEX|nr:hypothetical protein BV898_16002 [Hypsibius exemplaris]